MNQMGKPDKVRHFSLDEIKQRVAKIPLHKGRDLYIQAKENGLTLSQLLERFDPSGANDDLEAFHRCLLAHNINPFPDLINGMPASYVSGFFDDNDTGRILFPEFIIRAARTGLVDDFVYLNEILISGGMLPLTAADTGRAIYIDDAALVAARTTRVEQFGGIPTTKVGVTEEVFHIRKFGIGLIASYEFLRRRTIDLVATIVARLALNTAMDELEEAILVLRDGDSSGQTEKAAAPVVRLHADLGNTGSTNTIVDLDFLSYMKWLRRFKPGTCTHIVAPEAVVLQILNMPKPATDPLFLASMLIQSKIPGQPVILNPRMPGTVSFIIDDNAILAANKMLGLDRRYALNGYRETGSEITEVNKVINGQWEELIITDSVGFEKVFKSASKTFDATA